MKEFSLVERALTVFVSSTQPITAIQLAERSAMSELQARDQIRQLRRRGYAIYSNKVGGEPTRYRLGVPNRAMVAAAYAMGVPFE